MRPCRSWLWDRNGRNSSAQYTMDQIWHGGSGQLATSTSDARTLLSPTSWSSNSVVGLVVLSIQSGIFRCHRLDQATGKTSVARFFGVGCSIIWFGLLTADFSCTQSDTRWSY